MTERVAQRQALADKIRGDHSRTARRRQLTAMVLVVCGALVCAVVLAWVQLRPGDGDAVVKAPNHVSEDFGFTLTPELAAGKTDASQPEDVAAGVTSIAIYEDFLCDSCKTFHDQSDAFLANQLTAGAISVTYHPGAYLLTQSTDEYSQRAANAAVCVADQAGVTAYVSMHNLLLAHQPVQGGPGLTDDQLIAFAHEAGADDVADCVNDRTFTPWVEAASAAGLAAGITETPTILINDMSVVRSDDGRESVPGPAELQFAIEATQ